ncbi:hypothetical protein VIGAN_UM104100, partial [Vigna angularis var. angularis]
RGQRHPRGSSHPAWQQHEEAVQLGTTERRVQRGPQSKEAFTRSSKETRGAGWKRKCGTSRQPQFFSLNVFFMNGKKMVHAVMEEWRVP